MFEVYKCEVCGNITQVVHASGGTMVCCGKPMTLQQEKTTDPGKEKHPPVVERSAEGTLMKPGSVLPPMEEKHFIGWIDVRSGNNVSIKGLLPGEKPEAEIGVADPNVKVRAYCTMHGLWTNPP